MNIIDPCTDGRWDALVANHPRATIFHEKGWLEALNRTYGYRPFVVTSSRSGDPLKNGIVACHISSWVTGIRFVSLPFSDHCDPLLSHTDEFSELVEQLKAESREQNCRYIELRPLMEMKESRRGLQRSGTFCFHSLSLHPSLEQIFSEFHRDSIQRKIRRAERERLSQDVGSSEQLVEEFYRLLLLTRRRHQLIPQPRAWFRNLMKCLGEKVEIRLARKDGRPIAAILTVRHGSAVVYKYGCSDERFHKFGGMPSLFWRLIEDSKASGIEEIDFGRSDWDQEGLITFKERFGAKPSTLTYFRYSSDDRRNEKGRWRTRAIRCVAPILPRQLLPTVGSILYRHIG